jgi:BirA family biotin operon repressor/biotin-[acetyl-CoA-carboxylase] ligase
MNTDAILSEIFTVLIQQGELPVAAWPAGIQGPQTLGLRISGERILLRPNLELLTPNGIAATMTQQAVDWFDLIEVHPVIGSTNDHLVGLAEHQSIDGMVCLAELQTKGRGRRGRAWLSPFAGHLAMSVGMAVNRGLPDLGGLSLVVGLAVVDCLGSLGVEDLALKWPNDILLAGQKLGGILIELKTPVAASSGKVEAVIGIGLNIDLPGDAQAAVDQPITDLKAQGHHPSRNLVAGRLLSNLAEYVKQFEEIGFAPMRKLFNDHHLFHHQQCVLIQATTTIAGRVVGVTEVGELILETASGTSSFAAGEVSMRPARGRSTGCPG